MSDTRVQFTQYLRPNGRQHPVWIERPPEIARLAQQIKDRGYHFDIEELQDRTVSMTIEANRCDDDPVLAIELCPNGPDVPETVDRLILAAAERLGLSPSGCT